MLSHCVALLISHLCAAAAAVATIFQGTGTNGSKEATKAYFCIKSILIGKKVKTSIDHVY